MLTRIRNANMVRHEKLEIPASKLKREIAEILKREGFIRDVEFVEDWICHNHYIITSFPFLGITSWLFSRQEFVLYMQAHGNKYGKV